MCCHIYVDCKKIQQTCELNKKKQLTDTEAKLVVTDEREAGECNIVLWGREGLL